MHRRHNITTATLSYTHRYVKVIPNLQQDHGHTKAMPSEGQGIGNVKVLAFT
jgi:hypothetical protein